MYIEDPIERLVEFGLGVGIAQQMVLSMNNAMQQMYIPGQQMPAVPEKQWYLAIDGNAAGPFRETDVLHRIQCKLVNKDTLVWCTGMPEWKKAELTPEFLKLLIQTPPEL